MMVICPFTQAIHLWSVCVQPGIRLSVADSGNPKPYPHVQESSNLEWETGTKKHSCKETSPCSIYE